MSEFGEGSDGFVEIEVPKVPKLRGEENASTEQTSNNSQASGQPRNRLEAWLMKRMSRRDAVKVIGGTVGTAAGLGAAGITDKIVDNGNGTREGQPKGSDTKEQIAPMKIITLSQVVKSESTQATSPERNEFSLETTVSSEFLQAANEVVSMPLFIENDDFSDVRRVEEENLMNRASTFGELDTALSVCFVPNIREALINKRGELRAQTERVYHLDDNLRKYAEDNNINPEILALCQEVRFAMPEVLKKYFSDEVLGLTPSDKQNLDQVLAKGLAKLMMLETGGLRDIGDGPAEEQLAGEYLSDREVLQSYCDDLKTKTGLNYTPDNIPGSLRGSGDASGGAIGVQFMPRNAVQFAQYLVHAGYSGNIFDVKQGIAMAYLFMISKGYEQNSSYSKKVGVYLRWNPFPDEAIAIAKADEELMSIESAGD